MKSIFIIIVLFLTLVLSWNANSQSLKFKKAEKQYKELNYKRAVLIYHKVYLKNNFDCSSHYIEGKIANCYKLMSDTKNAELWYKKAVNHENTSTINYFYYAQMLQINGNYAEAKKYFNKYSKLLSSNRIVTNYLLDESTIKTMEKDVLRYDIDLLPINSNHSDIGPAYYENELVFLSTRDTFRITRSGWDNEPFFDIYSSDIDSLGKFGKLKKFDAKLNSTYHEGPLCFHPKYDIIYFTRSNDEGNIENNTKINKLSIYEAVKTKKGWTGVKKLWFNTAENSFAYPTISPDGMVLIYSSDKEGGYGGIDLYFSFWNKGEWSEPINLGDKINTKDDEVFPYFAADGKLYFSSNGREGLGGLDIYYTYPTFEDLKEIKNMGMPVNSTHDDFGIIKDKNDMGYFVSNRPTEKFRKDNIYSYATHYFPKLVNDTLEIPNDVLLNDKVSFNIIEEKLHAKTNSDIQSIEILTEGSFAQEFTTDNNDEITYWVNKAFKGMKRIDYVVTTKRGFKDTASIFLVMEGNTPPTTRADWLYAVKNGKGRVIDILKNDYDKDNNIMIDSVKIIEYPKNGGELINERRYVYYMPPKDFVGKDYCVYQIKDTRGGIATDTIYINVLPEFMGKVIGTGKNLDLVIHFGFNKWRIENQERVKLNKVAVFMKENPSILSQVAGHTDPVGSSGYNMILSLKRARATALYISLLGVNKNRLKVKGKGETDLIYKRLKGDGRGDPKNILNRRTTIKVLDY